MISPDGYNEALGALSNNKPGGGGVGGGVAFAQLPTVAQGGEEEASGLRSEGARGCRSFAGAAAEPLFALLSGSVEGEGGTGASPRLAAEPGKKRMEGKKGGRQASRNEWGEERRSYGRAEE